MKKQTKPTEQSQSMANRWTATARGSSPTKQAGRRIPDGDINELVHFAADWSKIPNTLIEDESGQLWLAFKRGEAIGIDEGFELVTVEAALTWIKSVSEFCDGYDGDIADVCRIALAELARRPARKKQGT